MIDNPPDHCRFGHNDRYGRFDTAACFGCKVLKFVPCVDGDPFRHSRGAARVFQSFSTSDLLCLPTVNGSDGDVSC